MNKFKNGLAKTAKFLRKNIYYVLIVVAVAAIGTMVAVALTRKNAGYDVPANVTPDDKIEEPIDEKPIDKPDDNKPVPVIFVSPVSSGAVSASYSDTELVFSNTLDQWSAHLGVDFAADEGTTVCAVYGGTVTAVDNDDLKGYCVTVSHGNGLVTKYCGMSDKISVTVGQKVSKGTAIGVVGNTMILESADGPHLHFETYKNNELINPTEYFITEEK